MLRPLAILLTWTLATAATGGPPAAATAVATAVPRAPAAALNQERPERGWFYYEDPARLPELAPAPPTPTPPALPPLPPPKEERCRVAATWTATCGFVNPGADFEFQAKQRDALLQQMVMAQNDPKAVEAFQYYMRWVMQRASEVANLWHYNMVQNPELDPQAQSPISPFGLRLMTEVQQGRAQDIFRALQQDEALLVYFTRDDCQFCHAMAPLVQRLGADTGLPVWNAALDQRCLPQFNAHCQAGKAVEAPAQALQVATVPTVFLYVRPNTWIRVATGVTDLDSMKGRMVSFFAAYRNALLKGVHNGFNGRAAVDFGGTEASGGTPGVAPAETTRLPTDADIRALLGQKP